MLPQSPQTAIAHLGAYKLGAIALPLFILFGPEALEHRLGHSGASVLVTDAENIGKVEAIRDALPNLRKIFVVGGAGHLDFEAEMAKASDRFAAADTRADDPAVIIYTSGTTGKPKGALHAHRVLLGHLPGVQLPQEFFPQAQDLFWTPADWAWIGGLLDVLLPSLYCGVPVLASRARKFDPEAAFVLPKPNVTPTAELAVEIQAFVRDRLAAYQYPREVEFVTELPLTATGKIMRKELRNREIEKQRGG